MPERLIDAEALLNFIDVGHLRSPTEICFSELDVKHVINNAPTVDAVRVVREKWEADPCGWHCSECGGDGRSGWKYCPNCGCDMRESVNGKK